MNPLRWTREHQLAGVIVCVFGAVLGVLMGFIQSPLFFMPQPWHAFVEWVSFPQLQWPWPVFGFLISGLIFYAVQLLRKSN